MLRRSDLGEVQWDQGQQHARPNALDDTHNKQHGNFDRASNQGAANEGQHCRTGQGAPASDPVGDEALRNGTDGATKEKQSIDCAENIGRVFAIDED